MQRSPRTATAVGAVSSCTQWEEDGRKQETAEDGETVVGQAQGIVGSCCCAPSGLRRPPEVFCEGVRALVAGVCGPVWVTQLLFSTVVRQDGA
jgi:hypothetical protein